MNILNTELVRILEKYQFQPRGATLLVGPYGQGKLQQQPNLPWYQKHGLRVAVIEADAHRPVYAQLSQLLEDTTVQVYGEPDNKDENKL